MLDNSRKTTPIGFSLYSESANINAHYGPWNSIPEYESWYSSKYASGTPIMPGTLIAIHNQTTDEVTLKIYSKGEWVDICSGNHDEDESDDPSPTPPDPQPPETVTLVSIAVSGQTTSYQVGDTFSFDGTCTATYSDDSQQTVTPTSVSTPSMSTSGSKTITVSYTENGITKTAKYTISVAAPIVKTASFIAVLRTVENSTTGKDKEVSYDNAKKDDVITYKVTIQNNGNVNLTGGKVTSTLPDVQDITFTFNPGGGSSYTYTHTVTQADVDTGFIHNKITASAQSAESGVANPTDVTKEMKIITVAASPSLTITKSANAPFTITTGTDIPYTITVKNTGNVTLASGIVADSKFVIPNNTFTSLVPGISKSYAYTYTVTQDDVNAGKIENTATASNIIAARGVNPTAVIASKTLIIPEPVTPIDPILPTDIPMGNIKAVDLGLPSGTKWANMNIGAVDSADIGRYFAWGELQPKSSYSWSNYKYCNGTNDTFTKYCTDASIWAGSGEPDGLKELQNADDAAKQLWGDEWCMPTSGQFSELFAYTHYGYATRTYNNTTVVGVAIPHRIYGSPILFLPISGIRKGETINYDLSYYWASNTTKDVKATSLQMSIKDKKIETLQIFYNQNRCYGMAIRPVHV